MTGARSGAALVLAVILSLVGVLLAHAALVLARSDVAASRGSARVLAAEHAARNGALAALDGLGTTPAGASAGDSVAGGGAAGSWSGRFEPISEEIWWVGGVGRAGRVVRRVGFPVWRADPARRTADIGAALVTGGTAAATGSAGISSSTFHGAPDPAPAAGCAASPHASDALPPVDAWRVEPDSALPSIGMLDLDELLTRADLRPGTGGVPGPGARFGACVESPWNWGDPGGSGSICARRMPVVAMPGGGVVAGGRGQGLLVTRGDLILRDTEYFGLLVVGGAVRLEGRARVTGAVLARAGAHLAPDSRIVGSRCWAEAALAAPAVTAPVSIEPFRWIRPDG